MGAVWVARLLGSEGVGRVVALKVMLNKNPGDADVQAFFSEARVTARLDHPNVVRTLELGQEEGKLFIAMELVRGQSLRNLLVALARQRRLLPLSLAVRIIGQAAQGLHAAHELCEASGSLRTTSSSLTLDRSTSRTLESPSSPRPRALTPAWSRASLPICRRSR
jgi:serine/threonine-protein kinase